MNWLKDRLARLPQSLKRFLVTGTLTVCVDAAVYASLLQLGVEVSVAKAVGLLAATIFAYFVNRLWTFEAGPGSTAQVIGFFALYAAAVLLNVAVNRLFLFLLVGERFAYAFSWFMATAASSTWNYLGMRYFVFRPAAT